MPTSEHDSTRKRMSENDHERMSERDSTVTDEQVSQERQSETTDGPAADDVDGDREEVIAQLELLKEENRRLRESYAQAKRTQYRRVAVGLLGVGVLALVGGIVFTDVRTVLFALGGTGVFGGLLTYYLTPERFIAASVGSAIYRALASNGEQLRSELGLQETAIYVPVGETNSRVRLFCPQHPEFQLPGEDSLESLFVVPDDPDGRGVALEPIGLGLFEEFESALDGPLGSSLDTLVAQLEDGVTEQFEIADGLAVDAAPGEGRLTIEVENGVYGSSHRFDHPVHSFVAVGLTRGLERPVRVETGGGEADSPFVTFRWENDPGSTEG